MTTLRAALTKSPKRQLVCLLAVFLLAIWGTRLPTIGHEITLQPDEQVFYNAASSVVYPDYTFRQVRDYPNGAFVFQMPFQFGGRVLSQMGQDTTLLEEEDQALVKKLSGRVAAIFYFSMGCLLGAVLLWRNLGQDLRAVLLYCLIMVFSLFQMEQSRYGTGDAISFFLLTVILYALDLYLREKSTFFLYFSALCVGVLAAVKFPLVYFVVLPCSALLLRRKEAPGPKPSLLKPLLIMLPCLLAGLILFSPQFFVDSGFFMKAFLTEFSAYMVSGNLAVVGTPLNHLVDAVLYQLLYSDFPLALPLAVYGVLRLRKENKENREQAPATALWTLVLPLALLVFFCYNLFAQTMFMRTFYPYFCLCIPYTAHGVARLMRTPRAPWMKWALWGLTAVMIIRGGMLVYALSKPSSTTTIYDTLTSHEKWEERHMTVMLDDEFIAGGRDTGLPPRKYMYRYMPFTREVPQLKPGEFVITGPMAYGYAQRRVFPTGNGEVQALCDNWETFRQENQPYLIGQPYPDHYPALFGSWIMGTTLTHYEFPTNYLYYVPDVENPEAPTARQYNALQQEEAYESYLQGLGDIEGCVVIATQLGDEDTDLVDALVSLFCDDEEDGTAYYGYDILVLEAGEDVIHSEAREEAREIPLDEWIDIDCLIRFTAQSNVAEVEGRSYTFYGPGYHLLVYDRALGCVVDWATLLRDEDGAITMTKLYDNNGNLAI